MNDRAKWLEDRRSGIGGSDVAAVCGVSKWKTPYALWQDKRGELPPSPDNEAMLWGRVLEPVIRQQYAERTGRIVRVPDGIIRSPRHDFMIANPDGLTDDRRLFEAKTARSAHGWGEEGSDEVPTDYMLQVQHYMAVLDCEVADVAVLIGGSDFRIYEVPADAELQALIIEAEAEFWQRVIDGNPPDPLSFADMQARYGRASIDGQVEATATAIDAIAKLRGIAATKATLNAEEEEAKAEIMALLGERDTLVCNGKPLVTWKAAKPSMRFDSSAFKDKHPDLYSQFIKAGESSRRFLLK
jgi:putative phage-type endonuclease